MMPHLKRYAVTEVIDWLHSCSRSPFRFSSACSLATCSVPAVRTAA